MHRFYRRTAGLVAIVVCSAASGGCWGAAAAEERAAGAAAERATRSLRSTSETPGAGVPTAESESEPPEAEAIAYRTLLERFARPAPDRTRVAGWAMTQVDALRTHLDRFPATPNRLQILQWIVTNELHVLGRFERASDAVDRLERMATSTTGVEGARLRERVDVLRHRIAEASGDRPAEITALETLLRRPTLVNRAFYRGRLADLTTLAVGQPMPMWTARALDGSWVDPDSWRGRRLVLWFWSEDDTRLERASRALVSLVEAESGLIGIGVPLDRDPVRIRRVVERCDFAWPQLWDPTRPGGDHPLVDRFNARAGPRGFVIDRRGIIRYRGTDWRALTAAVRSLSTR